MQIPSVGGSGLGLGALNRTNKSLEKILERISTAQRINRASDDAAGLAISEQLRSQVNGFKMASQNVSDAMSSLNIADGTSTEISAMLQRQRELALQASSDTINTDQRASLNVEYQQITQEITRIANSAQFNTQNVANGTGLGAGGAAIQVGPNGGDQLTLQPINMTAESLGVSGTSVLNQASATVAISSIDTALDALNTQRSTVGATVNRLESAQNSLMMAQVNTQAAESVLRDQNIAESITALTTQKLLQESGIRAFSRFNEISANHLLGLLK